MNYESLTSSFLGFGSVYTCQPGGPHTFTWASGSANSQPHPTDQCMCGSWTWEEYQNYMKYGKVEGES